MKEESIAMAVTTLAFVLALVIAFSCLGPTYRYGAEILFNGEDDLSDETWPMEELSAMVIFVSLSFVILLGCAECVISAKEYKEERMAKCGRNESEEQ